MKLIRSTILLAVLALGMSASPAQDDGEGADEGRAPSETPEQQPAPEEGTEPAPRAGDEDVFVPTEELDADEEATFPVDI